MCLNVGSSPAAQHCMGLSTQDSTHALSKVLASLTRSRSRRTTHSFSLFLVTEGCCIFPVCNLEGIARQPGQIYAGQQGTELRSCILRQSLQEIQATP